MSDETTTSNTPLQNIAPEMLGQPFWKANPVENGEETVLSVPIEHNATPVVAGEYFGNNDPGLGSGTPMEVKDGHLTVTMIVKLPVGSHPLNIRAKDANGVWSSVEATVLTVMTTPIITSGEGQQSQ